MYTYMAVVALATSINSANLSTNPTWLNDYGLAQQRLAAVKKPMAVFVGSGPEGWAKVIREGRLDSAAKKLLAQEYVCVYIDINTAAGKTMADRFELGRGLVISDRRGTSQAYSLAGTLTQSELSATLTKYADPKKVVETTETIVREAPIIRASYVPQYQYVPAYRIGGT